MIKVDAKRSQPYEAVLECGVINHKLSGQER